MGAGTDVILHPMRSSASPLTWPCTALLGSGCGRWTSLEASCPWQGPGILCSALGRRAAFLEPRHRPCGSEPRLLSKKGFYTVFYVLQFHVTALLLSFHGNVLQIPLPCTEGELPVLWDGVLPPVEPGFLGWQSSLSALCGEAGRGSKEGSSEAGGDRSGPRKKDWIQTQEEPSNRLFCWGVCSTEAASIRLLLESRAMIGFHGINMFLNFLSPGPLGILQASRGIAWHLEVMYAVLIKHHTGKHPFPQPGAGWNS